MQVTNKYSYPGLETENCRAGSEAPSGALNLFARPFARIGRAAFPFLSSLPSSMRRYFETLWGPLTGSIDPAAT